MWVILGPILLIMKVERVIYIELYSKFCQCCPARLRQIIHNQPSLYNFIKCRYQRLCEPEAENQLRPRHQQLWCQPLEETCKPFILHHTPHNLEPTLGILKISILYPRLDHVQRR